MPWPTPSLIRFIGGELRTYPVHHPQATKRWHSCVKVQIDTAMHQLCLELHNESPHQYKELLDKLTALQAPVSSAPEHKASVFITGLLRTYGGSFGTCLTLRGQTCAFVTQPPTVHHMMISFDDQTSMHVVLITLSPRRLLKDWAMLTLQCLGPRCSSVSWALVFNSYTSPTGRCWAWHYL